jgi:TolB-like protein
MLLAFGDYVLDSERRELRRGAKLIALEPQVFDLLVYLLWNRARVVSKDDLLQAVWGGRIVSDSALAARINAVRRALGDDGEAQRWIRTLPRRGFRFIGVVREEQEPASAPANALPTVSAGPPRPEIALPDKPSVAVLPFVNLSEDPEQEYFIDGVVEEIITALCRIRWLFVIAHNSSLAYRRRAVDVKQVGRQLGVRYILEGSVRKVGTRVRIAAQLIDATNGAYLWADRFDSSLGNIFELQDNVAAAVAGAIEPALQAAEAARSICRPTTDLGAYDCYLRALAVSHTMTKEAILEALGLLEQAIAIDRHCGPALAFAAGCHLQFVNYSWAKDPQAARRTAVDLARRALQAARDDPGVIAGAAMTLAVFGEDIGVMTALTDHALELNPSCALGWYHSGFLRLMAGEPNRAIELAEISLRLSPRTRNGPVHTVIGASHFLSRRFDEATAKLLLALEETPNSPVTYRYLAACYAHMGRLAEARDVVERLRAITPAVVPPDIMYLRNDRHRELYLSGLHLAAGGSNS